MTAPLDDRRRGLVYILAATVVAGVCGYLIQLAAPALLRDPHSYLAFSVFWSSLYLFVSAVAGVQQEVTRASRPVDLPTGSTTLRTFTLAAAGVLAIVAIAAGVVLSSSAFAPAPVAMTLWFAVGLVGYLLTAVLAGVLYGIGLWWAIASLTILDAVIRAIGVTVGLAMHLPTGVLAGLTAVPFVLAFGIVWLAIRRRVIGGFALDVGPRRLAANALSTVVGAAATGVLVTGLPLLLRTAMPAADATLLAGLILVITVTRAPLIIPLMALQSFLIVDFRRASVHVWGVLTRYLLLLAAVTAVLTFAAWAGGPFVFDVLSQGRYGVAPATAAVVVASAGLVAAMCITGPALLAEGRHRWFVSGWVLAAGATIVLIQLPLEPVERTCVALVAAPLLGVAVHLAGVRPSAREEGSVAAR